MSKHNMELHDCGTPKSDEELMEYLMNYAKPKSEAEWFASRKIKELLDEIETLKYIAPDDECE